MKCYILAMAYKPPRDLAESEALLQAEADRLDADEDRKGFWALSGGLLALVALVVVLASIVIGLIL